MVPPPCGKLDHAPPIAQLKVASTPLEVRAALQQVVSRLTQLEFRSDVLSRVELALSEALNNVVEHAQRDHPGGIIEIVLNRCATGLCIQVTDDGLPMPSGAPPAGNLPEVDVDVPDLPEGGFGWYLIRSVVDGMSYSRCDSGNCLHLCIHDLQDAAADTT